MALRTEVKQFAAQMEQRLVENSHKGPWPPPVETCDAMHCLGRLYEEAAELAFAIAHFREDGDIGAVIHEAADVANFAMLAWMACKADTAVEAEGDE